MCQCVDGRSGSSGNGDPALKGPACQTKEWVHVNGRSCGDTFKRACSISGGRTRSQSKA